MRSSHTLSSLDRQEGPLSEGPLSHVLTPSQTRWVQDRTYHHPPRGGVAAAVVTRRRRSKLRYRHASPRPLQGARSCRGHEQRLIGRCHLQAAAASSGRCRVSRPAAAAALPPPRCRRRFAARRFFAAGSLLAAPQSASCPRAAVDKVMFRPRPIKARSSHCLGRSSHCLGSDST